MRWSAMPLDFSMPGMNDVMPYPSTLFQDLGLHRLQACRAAWRRRAGRIPVTPVPDGATMASDFQVAMNRVLDLAL